MKDACLILAHPRTGSSLLMQTLDILGMAWVGQRERPSLPSDANPRGYLEDPPLLARGLDPEVLVRVGSLERRAAKLALSGMLAAGRAEQWQRMNDEGARLFIPFRHPLETAQSLRIFDGPDLEANQAPVRVLRFLYRYPYEYRALAHLLVHDVPELRARTRLIPHTLYFADAGVAVDRIREHAGLPVDEARRAQAIANISDALYRVRRDAAPAGYHSLYERMPVRQTYDLVSTQADPWEALLALPLPMPGAPEPTPISAGG